MTGKLPAKAFVGFVLFLLAGAPLPAAPIPANSIDVVFRMGNFDRSSREFSQDEPSQPVNFIAGKSDPRKDWYATQPVEGAAAAPWTITFSLDHAPAGSYRLHVALLIETAGLPVLRVGINGKQGRFYLQPQLDYSAGDTPGFFRQPYSHADVVAVFPPGDLRQGANTITLQAVEEWGKPAPGEGLTYDAMELAHTGGRFDSQASSARIVPTVFYQRESGAAGQLAEIVDVIVDSSQKVNPGGSVDLVMGGKTYRQPFRGDQDFGEERLEFAVPEFSRPTRAQVAWTAGGRRRHAEKVLDPQKKWTLFLVPHIHVDIGYSDYQAKVAAIQSQVLDEAMDFTGQHPDFRFSPDGEWNLEQFLKTRTPAEQQRIIGAIEKRQIFIPAQYANLLTGFATAETLIRSLYPSANFSRAHGSPFNYANITDVPSYSWSYASILASAGIKYFIAASDNYRGPVLLQGHLNDNSPMWWEGPDGQKIVFWDSRHYQQMEFIFGLPPAVSAGRGMLPLFLKQYEHPGYRADAALLFGTQAENTDLFPQQAELAGEWNKLYAYPRLQYSGFYDALKNIADQFGGDLPAIRGDGGPYWEDGIASDAYYAAMERGNESRGPSAEKLQTLTSIINPRFSPDKAALDRMWTDMVLMDEHTFTSYNSVSDPTSEQASGQLAVKNLCAINAHALADWLARNSMASIADSISVGPGGVVVFNTLNWSRSGPVVLDLEKGEDLVDASTGSVAPLEVLAEGNDIRRVRFVATDVPAMGYRVFLERPAAEPPAPAEAPQTTVLESPFYRVELDPASGSVRSIFDKQLARELVNRQSPYRFGQYLYVTGGDKLPNSLIQYRPGAPKPGLEIHPAGGGRLISVERTPYGMVARMKSTDTNTPEIATEIRLFNRQKKLEFVEDVDKQEVSSKEGVYFAFPFGMDHPRFQYEIQNGVVDPAKDMYPGAGHEWFSVQHWVSVEQDGVSATVMPLDASLVTLGDINRGAWPTQFGTRPGTIFSYVMNNYWDTNYRGTQGGHFHFRYVITSAPATDSTELSRMGWEEMTPLEKDQVTTQDKAVDSPRPLDGKQGSFLDAEDPNMLLETWKPAEDGRGTILRFLDLGGMERTVTVQTPYLALSGAWQTDAVERDRKPLSLVGNKGFAFTIHPHEIVTVRIVGSNMPGTH